MLKVNKKGAQIKSLEKLELFDTEENIQNCLLNRNDELNIPEKGITSYMNLTSDLTKYTRTAVHYVSK